MKSLAVVIGLSALGVGVGAASAGGQADGASASAQETNAPYDGRFAFVRLRYGGDMRGDPFVPRLRRGGR